jgi:hypothetical protein
VAKFQGFKEKASQAAVTSLRPQLCNPETLKP